MNPGNRILFIIILLLSYCSGLAQSPLPPSDGFAKQMDSLHRMRMIHSQGNQTNRLPFLPAVVKPASFNKPSLQAGQQPVPNTPQVARSARSMAICFDTAGRYFMQEDTMTYYVTNSLLLADGNILISGEWGSRKPPYRSGGFIMKCTDSGTLHWSRLYDSINQPTYGFINYYRLLELQDGSFLLAGATNNAVTQNNDVIITHTDNTGNIIWSKTYKSRVWLPGGSGSADYFYIQDLQQDPYTGAIFLSSPHWSDGYNITKFNIADGTVSWSKFYNTWSASFDRPIGFVITASELVSFSSYTPGNSFISMYRINKNTGDTIATRFYEPRNASNSNSWVGFLNAEGVTKLDNGNYALYGKQYKYYRWGVDTTDMYHAGVVEMDPAGNFVKAYSFRNAYTSNSYNTKIKVFKDGSGVLSMAELFTGYNANVYYVQFKDGQILKQRRKYYFGEGMPVENTALRLPDGSDLVVKLLGDSISNINKIEFLNLHISDTASGCLGWDDFGTYVEPYNVVPVDYGLRSIESNDLSESTNKTLITWNTIPYELPACRQVSNCDTLSLLSSADTICMSGGGLLITARKNPGCGASPFLAYDTSMVKSFRAVNDSMFLFNFKTSGEFTLHGSIQGCLMLTDSINAIVRRSNGQISLGKDTVICPGNNIQLNARKGYETYLWQDGSTDSVLQVTQPGIYHVLATDSCGNPFRDTLEVKPHPPIPFDIGMDAVTICEKDTVTITAPAAFFNYKWYPNYNTNSIAIQSIRVAPARDTMYYVSAEKTPGCYVYDSIRVNVDHSPPVTLGADASFCFGDSLVLDAGAGFSEYQWNTGAIAQHLTVFNAGKYWVSAEAGNGCKSMDTLQILQVFKNPIPNLGIDGPLCEGTVRLLNPGSFNQYSWNTGGTNPTLSVTQPGVYAVDVVDQHGCKGSDTVTIDRVVALPSGFLPADTTICNKSKYTFQPLNSFTSYHWSTGSTSSSLTVSQAGNYWLEVKDQYQCIGKDTITIALKDCLSGFYIPNAFTPDNNGKNDVFAPVIFGNLVKYEFHVYNRWGQRVFHSTDIGKGWDGMFKGVVQSGMFVWVCIWQLEDEEVKKEKGVVEVLR